MVVCGAVGSWAPRADLLDRVLGRTRFAGDIRIPGCLHLAVVRSTEAHARVIRVDAAPALEVPGVVRVFTAADVPGENRYGIIPPTADQHLLADGRVRMVGDPVALVAAETPEAAREAARRVRVVYERLPAVFDPEQALADGAPPVHERGNLCFEQRVERGDWERALAGAHVVVERTYRTAFIEHAYIEPEASVAYLEDGVLVVVCSTQNPHYDRADLCRLLGLSEERVRVIQAPTGGAFGGKLDLGTQPFVALATWLTGRPSRLVYSREESFLASPKRHPFRMRYRTAADRQGRILGVEADLLMDTGAYASYGMAVAIRAAVHAAGPYRVGAVRVCSRAVYTNHPIAGAMRGFGTPQVAFAYESQMDLVAEALGIDPLEVRLRNALRPGDETATGQRLGPSVGLVECLEKVGRVRQRWLGRKPRDGWLRGVGVGAMYYGIGNTGVPNPSSAHVRFDEDGGFTLFTGAAELGQGSDRVLLAVCAEALGVEPESVRLVRADTGRTANAGATSASRQTYISGAAVLEAARELRRRILERAEDLMEIPAGDLVIEGDRVRSRSLPSREIPLAQVARAFAREGPLPRTEGRFDPPTTRLDPRTGQGAPYATYAFAAQVADVRVDAATGRVRVERIAAAHDVGRAVFPPGVRGQIAGGAAMGVGMALMEAFRPGRDRNLDTYLIPTVEDAPRVHAMIVEAAEPTGPFGAKGVGEPALIPTAPAVVNALARACGRRIHSLPAGLEAVLAALRHEE